MSARATYDLTVPGGGDYSIMNALARAGFDVWSVDHENYGRSSRTDGNADVASGSVSVDLTVTDSGAGNLTGTQTLTINCQFLT